MNIVITDSVTVSEGDLSFDFLNKFGNVTAYELTDESEAAERIRDADIVLCNKTILNRGNLSAAKNLKYIGLFATGYNNIDLDYAREKSIAVCNAPAYSTEAVAQLVFAFILGLTNKVHEYSSLVADGAWISSRTFSFFPIPLRELAGKTIGIIGYGSIGSAVARIAVAFGMNVLVYTRTPKADSSVSFVSLDELLAQSDFVSCHCPLNEQSRHMINSTSITKMRDGAVLINTSRGPVVDELALADALKSGKLSAACVDVLENEPMRSDCPLFGVKNCVITPHIAWAALETRERLLGIVEENIRSFISGKTINNVCG